MTPPFRIQNFTTGSVYPRPGSARADGEALLEPARDRIRARAAAESEASRASGRSHFLYVQPNRYGTEEILPRFAEDALEDMNVGLDEWLQEARRGERRMYFESLRLAYALLARSPEERRGEMLERILSLVEEYDQFLGLSPLSPLEKFRYLFAASRVLQATLAFTHDHPVATGGENFEIRITQALRMLDAHLTNFFAEQDDPSTSRPAIHALFQYIRLREATLSQNAEEERLWALSLETYLTDNPLELQAGDWADLHLSSLLRDPDYLDNLALSDQPAEAERETLALGALALDLTIATGWTLDAIQEEDEAVMREQYRSLALVMTALLRLQPEYSLEETLEYLAEPRGVRDNLRLIEQSIQRYPDLQEIPAIFGEGADWQDLLARAQAAATHLLSLREGAGRSLLDPIFQLSHEGHPIRRMADALRATPDLARQLDLPSYGLSFYFARANQAVELYRRGNTALRVIEGRASGNPETRAVLELLEAQGSSASLREFLQAYLESAQLLLDGGQDHELAALQATLQIVEENRETYREMGVPQESLRHAGLLATRMEGWDFRGRQTVRHLFGSSNLIGIGAGILMTELFPTLMILRAGAGGRLALRGLGNVVNAGRLTLPGEALVGVTTGLAMSGMGSLLHNAERERLGLRTHTLRDALEGGLLNAVVFGMTLPFSRVLGNSLAWNNWQRRGAFGPNALRSLLHHSATVAFAGTASLGIGILYRGVRTGELHTTPEEWIENFGSILLWEMGAAGLRWGRRRIGLGMEIAGLNRPPSVATIPGEARGPLGRMGGRAWRSFQRALFTTVGPFRIGWAEELTGRLVASNPGLRGSEARITEALIRQESFAPGTLAHFEGQLRLGGRPAWLGSSEANRLVMLRGEHLPRAGEIPARHSLGPPDNKAAPNQPASPREEAPASGRDPENSASSDTLAPSTEIAPQRGAFVAGPVPAAGEAPDPIARTFYFAVSEPGPEGESGILRLRHQETGPNGERIYTIGRENFDFLSPEVRRIISRRHFQMILDTEGNWRIQDMSRAPRPEGENSPLSRVPAVEDHGTHLLERVRGGGMAQFSMLNPAQPMAIEPGMSLTLGQPRDGIHLTFLRMASDGGNPSSRPPSPAGADVTAPHPGLGSLRPEEVQRLIHREPSSVSAPPPSTRNTFPGTWPQDTPRIGVALDPGRHSPFEGMVTIRDRGGSLFRLLGAGGTRVSIVRTGEDGNARAQSHEVSENPILGEIGEDVGLILNPGENERRWILSLDDPQGSGRRLPQVALQYGNASRILRFRATSPSLNMGRIYSEGLFVAPWISRQHIVLELVERGGNPRFRLTTQGRWGLRVNGEILGRGEAIELSSGRHDLEFPLREQADLFDTPVRLELPPIEVNFPEWKINLRTGHDRGVLLAPVPQTTSRSIAERQDVALPPERPSSEATGELRISFPERPWWKRMLGID